MLCIFTYFSPGAFIQSVVRLLQINTELKTLPCPTAELNRGPNTPEQHAAFTHFCGQRQNSSDAAFVDALSVVVVGLFVCFVFGRLNVKENSRLT
jgi:hypothetical protein